MFPTWLEAEDDGRGTLPSAGGLHEPLREGAMDAGAVEGPGRFLEGGEKLSCIATVA